VAATVLCIESDPGLSELLARALREQGLRVIEASEAVRALALAHEDPPDLVLLSVELSEGALAPLEALRDLPEPAGRMPVVLLCDRPPAADEALRAAELSAAAVLTKPVALARLLEIVSEQLAKVGTPIDSRAPSADGDGVAGSLERMPFPFLLHHLHGLRADGVLHLVSGRKAKWLQLRAGQPVAVRSNLVSECLGNFLVRTGRIAAEIAAESRRRMGQGQLQGEVLVAMDALSPEEVADALVRQADEKLFEVFGWGTGEFRFERGGRLQRANGLASGRGTANLILSGVRTRMSLEPIDATLRRRADRVVAQSESPFYRFQELALEAHLRDWVERLPGTALGHALALAEEQRRCLYALLATGFLTLRPPVATSLERVAPPPRERAAVAPRAPSPDEERVRAELAELAARIADVSPFEVLEVAESAPEHEIRAAYERLLERVHPDRVGASSRCSPGAARVARPPSARRAAARSRPSCSSRRARPRCAHAATTRRCAASSRPSRSSPTRASTTPTSAGRCT
jgi:CheY-like chemotaxis protein